MELIQNNPLPIIDYETKLIIGLAGKKMVGKSTIADLLVERATRLNMKAITINYGDILKDEVAAAYGFDRSYCDTQKGKETKVEFTLPQHDPRIPHDAITTPRADGTLSCASTVRRLLQWYGTDYRRAQDPDYWTKATSRTIQALCETYDVIIIADVRFPNECIHVTSYPYNYLCRIHPHQNYVYTEESSHISETALDMLTSFDDEWYPKYGRFYLQLVANKITINVLSAFKNILEAAHQPLTPGVLY